MQKVDCTQSIVQYCDDVLFMEVYLLWTIKHLLQIRLDVFHYYEKVAAFEQWLMNNILKLGGEHIGFHIR